MNTRTPFVAAGCSIFTLVFVVSLIRWHRNYSSAYTLAALSCTCPCPESDSNHTLSVHNVSLLTGDTTTSVPNASFVSVNVTNNNDSTILFNTSVTSPTLGVNVSMNSSSSSILLNSTTTMMTIDYVKMVDEATQIGFAICTLVKDEPDLEQWISYHLLLGFERIILYDDCSSIPLRDRVRLFGSRVTVFEAREWYPGSDTNEIYNVNAHRSCIRYAVQQGIKWLAIIDIDEYLVLNHHGSLSDFVASFPLDVGAIGLNWILMGGIHDARPNNKLLIEAYTHRERSVNNHLKRIFRPEHMYRYYIHHGDLKLEFRDVDVFQRPIDGPWNRHVGSDPPMHRSVCDVACLFHYRTRSYEDFVRRMARGEADRPSTMRSADVHHWSMADFRSITDSSMAVEEQTLIQRRWPERVRGYLAALGVMQQSASVCVLSLPFRDCSGVVIPIHPELQPVLLSFRNAHLGLPNVRPSDVDELEWELLLIHKMARMCRDAGLSSVRVVGLITPLSSCYT